ncbi:MAG: dihydroxyacetone kinase subunit L [Phycisphaerae bacterium]|nr:dihydroxyacetone kinase subunit L [Phycisphaerae bacterium]
MPQTIGSTELTQMLRTAAARIRQNHEMLSRLDSFGGDGDHGTTMLRAMTILEKTLEKPAGDPKTLLTDIGWAVMGVDGGATGPLFGTFFTGMADPAAEAIDAGILAAMFEAGLLAVQGLTKARPGDKTMIDALVPAVEAVRAAAEAGDSITQALDKAALAAEQGADATKNMKATFGRAKNIGEKSIGNPDPGATSVSLIFRGFSEGVR